MNVNVDLRQLAVRRDEPPPRPARRRHLLTRYVLPGTVLLGFLAVLGWSARASLLPPRPVTVVPVLTTRTAADPAGTPLFQAAGWVEPRPTPVLATALTEGVVEQLLVVEGQEVRAGEPVARLVEADARLALRAGEADLELREADVASAAAALTAARANLARPVHLEAAAAEADALLAQKETELGNLPFQVRMAQTRLDLARHVAERMTATAGAIPERTLAQADSEARTAAAALEEVQQRRPRLEREVAALTARRDALTRRRELKTEEIRNLAEAEAGAKAAAARVRQARVALDAARLRLERTTVRSPITGRVLGLVARPGTRLMGLDPRSLHDASTVVSLYDPASLQVRADVRLEDVPRVRPGQPVRIETPAAAAGPLDGHVLAATSQADVQKNTLQVKVSVKDPPPVLKPDMLVQVTFLAPPGARGPEDGHPSLRLLVPRLLVEKDAGGAHVWIPDQAAGVARLRPVELGPPAGDLIEVTAGLNAADKLIAAGREGLREGDRITITGEDPTLGAGGNQQGKP
jgi:RND family efflux transporter MFP subunit